MSIEGRQITIGELSIDLVRKDIKNLHLAVYPPNGRVRVAAPLRISDEAVRLAVVSRIGWIRRRQRSFAEQDRQSEREFVSSESHYVMGRRYRLQVNPADRPAVSIRGNGVLEMRMPPETDAAKREAVLNEWYRAQIKAALPDLLAKWEPVLGVHAADVRVRRMRTRWGSYKAETGRVWLNLELGKKHPRCWEYVLVHEMVHLLERRHNDRFIDLMSAFLPQWRMVRDELNAAPLAHEDWRY